MKKRNLVAVGIVALTVAFLVVNLLVRRSLETFFGHTRDSVESKLGHLFTAPHPMLTDEKANSELFLTYVNALSVARAVQELGPSARVPGTSAELSNLEPRRRLDAWAHPFCLAETSDRIVVISVGSAPSSPRCAEAEVDFGAASTLPVGVLNRLPSGRLLLRVDKLRPISPRPQAFRLGPHGAPLGGRNTLSTSDGLGSEAFGVL